MAASLFDSQLYSAAFPTAEAGRLFSDSAEVRAMLLVEGALAKAQGHLGIIPADSAAAIQRAVMEVAIDPGALRAETGRNGVPVPALVAAFRKEMSAPEHAQYVHWGATSQDIMDTALMLRLRQALSLIEADIVKTVTHLGALAQTHAALPMAVRSFGLHATPTSFGAVVASWGAPLLGLLTELPELRRSCLLVSLSGAAGTSAALGEQAAQIRQELARGLALGDPERSWHTDRTPILRLADWMHRTTLAMSKIGQDILAATQTGIEEITLTQAGGSSTMPQKRNPVSASVLAALASHSTGLHANLQSAAVHQNQRDPSAWFTEWLCLPQIVLTASSAAYTATLLVLSITPNGANMRAALDQGLGLIHAEALTFALSQTQRGDAARDTVKTMIETCLTDQRHLRDVARQTYPDLALEPVFDPSQQMGTAAQTAREFSNQVSKIKNN